MPIAKGQKGRPGVLAVPGDRFLRTRPFRSTPFSTKNEMLSWVSRDSTGAPLGNCVIKVFRTLSDTLVATTVSDANGNWSINNPGSGPFYFVQYKVGAPDVAGTSVNTIVAT